jgi:hypothetical protein
MFITAVLEESEPWQLVHLQWTPAAPTGRSANDTAKKGNLS